MLLIIISLMFLLIPESCYSQDIADYLITEDISIYSFRAKTTHMGDGSGIVGLTSHFSGHDDFVYTCTYSNIGEIRGLPIGEARKKILSVDVQVTQHTGSDSDRWLLHEMDSEFRNYYGIPGLSFTNKNINGYIVFVFSSGGRDYRWISGNKVVMVEYTDLMMEKPEPIEVVKAYLAKHPSTLSPVTLKELRSIKNTTKWIKDEMERRLWLCDKWFAQLQLGNVELTKVLRQSVNHINVFLDYRDKYYGIASTPEKKSLWEYLQAKDGTSIRNKLSEYRSWWDANKTGAINIP